MYVCPEGYIELSRSDAARLKVTDKDLLTVTSSSGNIKLKAKVSMRMPEGVAFAPYHFADTPVNQVWSGAPVTWVTLSK